MGVSINMPIKAVEVFISKTYIFILSMNLILIEAHLGAAFAQCACIRANTVI